METNKQLSPQERHKKEDVVDFTHCINSSRSTLRELSEDIEDCKEDELVTAQEFSRFCSLVKSADYLSGRYLQALYRMQTGENLKSPNQQS